VKLGLANNRVLIVNGPAGQKGAGAFWPSDPLGSMSRQCSALIFSVSGGLFAYLVMCLTIGLFPEKLIWVVSTLGALGHNAGQLAASIWVTGTPSLLVYAPALLAAGIFTGVFTGLGAMYLIRAAKKLNLK
jgi:heptaprenyl diphosphate synthase